MCKFIQLIPAITVATVLTSICSLAATFDFKDPKGVNSMTLTLDSQLEPIRGTASDITGTLDFDPASPNALSGKLVVPATSVKLTNARMTEVLHSEDWINAAANPTIEFSFGEVISATRSNDTLHKIRASGKLLLNGVTREMEVDIMLSYLPGKMRDRGGKVDGDLVILRSNFEIDRADFNIKPEMDNSVVGHKIEIGVGIVGLSPKS